MLSLGRSERSCLCPLFGRKLCIPNSAAVFGGSLLRPVAAAKLHWLVYTQQISLAHYSHAESRPESSTFSRRRIRVLKFSACVVHVVWRPRIDV
jgi:hypothetical protein